MMALLNGIEKKAIFILVAFCLILLFINISSRYLLNYPLGWTEEISTYLYILIIYLGTSVGAWENKQIKISIVPETFPKLAKFCEIFSNTAAFTFSICLVVLGYNYTKFQWILGQKGVAIEFPIYWVYAILPVCGFLIAIKYGKKLLALGMGKR